MRRKSEGQALLLSIVLLAVVLGLAGAFISYLNNVQHSTKAISSRATARQAAMSGLEKAVWCLNQSNGNYCGGTYGLNFVGETAVQAATDTYYTTTVANVSANLKTITSVGYYPSATQPLSTITMKMDVTVSTQQAAFHYGIQAGNGGFNLDNNAFVTGNIYANGSITGGNGSYVTGAVFVAGGTQLNPDQQSTVYNADFTFGRTSPQIDIAQSFSLNQDSVVNKVSFYLKQVGGPNDVDVYILADNAGVPSKTVIGQTTLNAAQVGTSYSWVDATFSTPPGLVGHQTYWLAINASSSSNKYWIIGDQPNSGYGNGRGVYTDDWSDSFPDWSDAAADFDFKVWTGGVTTSLTGVHVYQDAHANTISNSTVDHDAYYQNISGSTVHGASHPGSPDPGPQPMPISQAQIDNWKAAAAGGGTTVGDVTIDGAQSLGPKAITGNLNINNGAILTVTGTIYVQGNINVSPNATIQLTPGYGSTSGIIIADGRVSISNNVAFYGSGTTGSYVLVLTTNPSLDPNNPALDLNNNSSNSIFYAANGVANVANGASLKELTAFTIHLKENASVQYESGLANVNFSTGPGGSWVIQAGSFREVH